MRARQLIVGGLALLLGACSGGGGPPPPALNKQLLPGTWKNVAAERQFVTGYEFAGDDTLKMTVRGMEQPVSGRYTWSGDRTLDVEFEAPPEVRQAYTAAAKAYKVDLQAKIKAGDMYERAGPSLSASAPDELPTKVTFHVGLSEKPRLLILSNDQGTSQSFEPTK
jgi:hypothetical protein